MCFNHESDRVGGVTHIMYMCIRSRIYDARMVGLYVDCDRCEQV